MTIGKSIATGFAFCVLVTAGLGVFSLNRVLQIHESVKTITTAELPGLMSIGEIEANSKQNVIVLYRHITSEDAAAKKQFSQDLEASDKSIDSEVAEYEKTINDDSEKESVNAIKSALLQFRTARAQSVAFSEAGKTKESLESISRDARPANIKLTEALKKLREFNQKSAADAGADADAAVASSKTGIISGLVIAVLGACGIAFWIVSSVNRSLNRLAGTLGEGSAQVASASSQVAGSSQSLAQGASEQAAALEETTSALEEMSSMTKKNAETAQSAAAISEQTKNAADKSNAAMGRMSTAINDIQKSSAETAKIIKVIDEIAFQTNLLALNAAVEAARAGESGKGFAVVAEEVRNLARRSADAAKSTSAMIEESVNNSKAGVAITSEVASALDEITSSATKMNSLVAEIAAASTEQSQGINQVNLAVSQMDKVTQSSAANAEESAAASEELSAQAQQMASVVDDLLKLVGGARSSSVASVRTPASKLSVSSVHASTPSKSSPRKSSGGNGFPLDDKEATDFKEFGKAA